MKTIFVPTDFSSCANNATLFAMHLASKIKAEVVLFNGIALYAGTDSNAYSSFFIEEFYQSKKEKLEKMIELLNKNEEFTGVKVRAHSVIGPTISSIVDESTACEADLIVMGTHGASGVSEILLGSNAASTIADSIIPVLAVPEHFTFQKMNETFVFAADYESFELNGKSKKVLKALLEVMDASVKIVHVADDVKEKPDTDKENAIKIYFEDFPHQFYYLRSNSIADAINKFAEEMEASLITTINHKYSFMDRLFVRSKSKQLAYHATIPLLSLYELA